MRISDSAHGQHPTGERAAPLKTCVLSWLALAAGGWLVIASAVYALTEALS